MPERVQLRSTVAVVDRGALAHNLRVVDELVDGAGVLAVVKADAYGHGATVAAQSFLQAGAWGVAVSLVEEALELRGAGIGGPIVVLGGVVRGTAEHVVVHRLTPIVWNVDQLTQLAAAVRALGARPLPVHLKLDTGMTRLGVRPGQLAQVLEWFVRDAGHTLVFEGVLTHLACADDMSDTDTSRRQLQDFAACLGTIAACGLRPRFRHVCNSAGLARFPAAHYDLVRPGIVLYGSAADPSVQVAGVRPCMSVQARLLTVRELPAGTRVSYGGHDTLTRRSRVAVVPLGYADGYARNMSTKAHMLVRGRRCRVLGAITMDATMLDVTELPDVEAGEPVVALGSQAGERLTVRQLADWAGVLTYEVTCAISKRVPRRYQ